MAIKNGTWGLEKRDFLFPPSRIKPLMTASITNIEENSYSTANGITAGIPDMVNQSCCPDCFSTLSGTQ